MRPTTRFRRPPTANGKPGIHHVFARTIKDLVCRYQTMRGFQVHRKAGWDTHGLPVEIEVEKKLGLKHKGEIETVRRRQDSTPNAASRSSSTKTCGKTSHGAWATGSTWSIPTSPAKTSTSNPYGGLWTATSRKALIYQGFKVQLYCPRCGTPLSSHEVSLGYRDVQDPSVYIKAKIKGEENTSFLVWTTTPWTLISNVGSRRQSGRRIRQGSLQRRVSDPRKGAPVRHARRNAGDRCSMHGRDLVGKEYERWFSFYPGR